MNPIKRILLFFVLPFIAPMLYPPKTLSGATIGIGIAALLFIMLGVLLWRGRSLALTFSIFLQGMNVIIRLMMVFPHAKATTGQYDMVYIITSILSIALSYYLVTRLDQVDVRSQMIA